jgi:long-chain fatty acid transport protein
MQRMCLAVGRAGWVVRLLFLGVLTAFAFDETAEAANGLIPIAFGTEASAMGGADTAVARDTSALNVNPAGLAQTGDRRLDIYAAASTLLDRRHTDKYGNDVENAQRYFGAGTGSFATRLGNLPVWLGTGLFLQSGAGVKFQGMTTAFGTTDDLESLLTTVRLNLGAAWQVGSTLSIGASLGLNYSRFHQKAFPNTSSSSPLFFGQELKNAAGIGFGAILGVLYRPNKRHSFGIAYGSPVDLPVKNGHLVTNQSAIGLGTVTYADARIDGLRLPQTVSVGYALQANPDLLLSIDGTWIDWSGALRSTTLTASNPDNAGAAAMLQATEVHNWNDQYVLALGLAYDATDALTLYAGYNHARNPTPPEHLDPTLAGITEQHFTTGLRYQSSPQWWFYGALEYGRKESVTYDNPALPFGPGATESGGHLTLHLTASRLW